MKQEKESLRRTERDYRRKLTNYTNLWRKSENCWKITEKIPTIKQEGIFSFKIKWTNKKSMSNPLPWEKKTPLPLLPWLWDKNKYWNARKEKDKTSYCNGKWEELLGNTSKEGSSRANSKKLHHHCQTTRKEIFRVFKTDVVYFIMSHDVSGQKQTITRLKSRRGF